MFDESFSENWRARYGLDPDFEIPSLAKTLGHRSIRKFSDQLVSEEMASALIAAAQSAATSSNLQLWSVVSVQDREKRDQLATLCANDQHVRDCAWFFCFLADHYRLRKAAEKVGEKPQNLDYAEFYTMAVIDAALAAERMVGAAESRGLGICYIGGLRNHPQEVAELLGMPEGTFGVFGLCVGHPVVPLTAHVKPRLRQDAIWFRETYDLNVSTDEYDARMRGFYESEQMKGEVTWSMRSGRRLHRMTGRENQLAWLHEHEFLNR